MDTQSIWGSVLSYAEETINPQTFERWFAPCRPKALSKKSFIVEVPNVFHQNWMSEHYGPVIQEILRKSFDEPPKLEIHINPELEIAPKDSPISTTQSEHKALRPMTSYIINDNVGTLNPRYTFENFV